MSSSGEITVSMYFVAVISTEDYSKDLFCTKNCLSCSQMHDKEIKKYLIKFACCCLNSLLQTEGGVISPAEPAWCCLANFNLPFKSSGN